MRAILVLALALVCGVSAAVGVSHLRKTGGVDTTSVVVARSDIPARAQMLTEDQVELRDWPSSMVPRHAAESLQEVVGRAAAVPIVVGDVLSDTKLSGKDAGRGVAALVPPGMRAYTIQTSKNGQQRSGLRAAGQSRGPTALACARGTPLMNGREAGMTLLQGVEILAVDQRLDGRPKTRSIPRICNRSHFWSRQQAAMLDLERSLGRLTFRRKFA